MLPRDRRLHADRDWDALFQHGFGVPGHVLSLRIRPTPGARRLGVSVGRRVGGAVTRNLLKRRLRALARAHWDALPEADMAILARPSAGGADYVTLERALLELFARAQIRMAQRGDRV